MLTFPYIHIIKYKHSNHFYSEILVQDVNTYITRVNLQTLLPETWVVSDVSKMISVIKEVNQSNILTYLYMFSLWVIDYVASSLTEREKQQYGAQMTAWYFPTTFRVCLSC